MTHSVHFSSVERSILFRGLDTEMIREMFAHKKLETPQLLLSSSEVAHNYDTLKRALPRTRIHYAVKSNNHPGILRQVHQRGGNFDVCSLGEIDEVLKLGVDPKTLIHSHPIKSVREFDGALERGLDLFVVDNPNEVRKLERYRDRKLRIMIRFRIYTNTTAVVNLQYKFGCMVDEVLPLARMVREAGHEFYGLCFHIGSQCVYADNYIRAIEAAHDLITGLDMEGFDTRLLDIGGGFPAEYVEPIPAIDELCGPINRALDEHIRPGIVVACEPGRFISASSVTLICSVIGKSFRDGKMWYYLDDGLYSTFSGILFDHCQYPVVTDKQGEELLSVLAGPTCDLFDVMYDGLMVPERPDYKVTG